MWKMSYLVQDQQMASDIILTKEAIVPNAKHITQLLQFLSDYNDISRFEVSPSEALRRQQSDRFASRNIAANASEQMLKMKDDRITQRESELNERAQTLNDREYELAQKQRTLMEREKRCTQNMTMLEADEELFDRRKRQQQQQLALIVAQSHKNTQCALQLEMRERQILARERQHLFQQNALAQREKSLLQREHALNLRLKLKGGH